MALSAAPPFSSAAPSPSSRSRGLLRLPPLRMLLLYDEAWFDLMSSSKT